MTKRADLQEQDSGIIQAAGGLVWRDTSRGKQIALVHRPKYDDWSLPKGKLKVEETWQAAALREVDEEIQCRVKLGYFSGCCCYPVEGTPKVVLFWVMELIEEGDFQPNKEIDQLAWLSFDQAIERLDYESERRLLRASELESK